MTKEVFPGITVDQQIIHGRPVIAGTRVTVEAVLGELASGSSIQEVMDDYHLTDEQVRAALGYATHMLKSNAGDAAIQRDAERARALEELTQLNQELGLYDQ